MPGTESTFEYHAFIRHWLAQQDAIDAGLAEALRRLSDDELFQRGRILRERLGPAATGCAGDSSD